MSRVHAMGWLQTIVRVLFVAVVTVIAIGNEAYSVPLETPEEKRANYKKQAAGGLFQKWTFDQERSGQMPTGFIGLSSLNEQPADWIVREDAMAPSPPHVLAVSPECSAGACFELLLAEGLEYEYPDVTVRFRSVDRAVGIGGIAFGVKDAKNFYAALVDVAGSIVQVVRVTAGSDTLLGQAPVNFKAADWHTLRVQRNTIISKDFIETYVDGTLVLSVEDQVLGLGKVGLAVRGKSSWFFDSLHAVPLFSHRPLSSPPAY